MTLAHEAGKLSRQIVCPTFKLIPSGTLYGNGQFMTAVARFAAVRKGAGEERQLSSRLKGTVGSRAEYRQGKTYMLVRYHT
jgi:hypothetical protein